MPQPDRLRPLRRQRAFFVYYKVERLQAARLQQAFARMAAPVADAPASTACDASGVSGASGARTASAAPWRAELMRRVDSADASAAAAGELQTWMEIYWLCEDAPEPAPGAAPSGGAAQAGAQAWNTAQVRQMIEERARDAGILDLVHGERHYEAFDSCA